jgi:flagellar motor component MotA
MTKADPQSALEREIEETRERLAGTIDQLLYRSSPKTIARREVASLRAVYVDPATGQPNTGNILRTAGVIAGVIGLMVALRKLTR